jgi:antitoxin component YwqK of YwqJK toxin-antitoxin module
MKSFLLALMTVILFTGSSHGQTIDTVQTFDYGKMPPVYFSNKVYWEKNYDKDNHLLFEALKYNSCFIGAFVNYWNNGRVKTCGQYLRDTTVSLKDMVKNDKCSTMHGGWKNFSEAGVLISTFLYDKGKIIKEY